MDEWMGKNPEDRLWLGRSGGKRFRKIKYMKQSLRFPVAILYILVVMLIVAENFLLQDRFETLSLQEWLFLGIGFMGLLLMEWLESLYYPRRIILPVKLTLLALRIFCVAAIFMVDHGVTSPTIAAIILFAAFFYLGLIPVLLLGLLFLLALVAMQPEILQAGLIGQVAVMIYMTLFAIIIKQDDRTRTQNLALYRELMVHVGNSARQAKQVERTRIARELHDSLGHHLVGMNLQLQKATAYREIDAAESDAAIEKVQQACGEAIRELRQTVSNLREMEDTYDFMEEVQKLVDGVEQSGLTVNFACNGSPLGFSELTQITLQRAVQEGLTNIQKHADARQVGLQIDFNRSDARLLLSDDGVGFQKKKIDEEGHYGLFGLEERIDMVGGRIRIRSRKGKGTQIFIRIPKTPYA